MYAAISEINGDKILQISDSKDGLNPDSHIVNLPDVEEMIPDFAFSLGCKMIEFNMSTYYYLYRWEPEVAQFVLIEEN